MLQGIPLTCETSSGRVILKMSVSDGTEELA